MKIKYDEEADAMYIELKKGDFAKNKKINDSTILDLDQNDNLLGIEILDASKKIQLKSFLTTKKSKISNLAVSRNDTDDKGYKQILRAVDITRHHKIN